MANRTRYTQPLKKRGGAKFGGGEYSFSIGAFTYTVIGMVVRTDMYEAIILENHTVYLQHTVCCGPNASAMALFTRYSRGRGFLISRYQFCVRRNVVTSISEWGFE